MRRGVVTNQLTPIAGLTQYLLMANTPYMLVLASIQVVNGFTLRWTNKTGEQELKLVFH